MPKISKYKIEKTEKLKEEVRKLYRTGLTVRQVVRAIDAVKSRGWVGNVVKEMDNT